MTRHEATFDISSRTDKRAVRRLMDRAYNTLREELRTVEHGESGPKETLEQFEAIRDAAANPSTGTLTVVYESEEPSDDDSTDG